MHACVQMLRLCDRYGMATAADACMSTLACLSCKSLLPSHINELLHLIGELGSVTPAQRARIHKACESALLAYFGDVNAVVNSGPLTQLFLQLAAPAVLLWAASPSLTVLGTEDEVVALLDKWVRAQSALQAAELSQLSATVCVSQLSTLYRSFVLPGLPWFNLKPQLLQVGGAEAEGQCFGWCGIPAVMPPCCYSSPLFIWPCIQGPPAHHL